MSAVLGSTLMQTAGLIAEAALPFAADHLQADKDDIQFADGIFTATGTNQSVTIEDLVRLIATDDLAGHPLNRLHKYTTDGATYPYGCHVVEIEVDQQTLRPEIVTYTVVDDFGEIINPLTLEGQIHGGIAGIGQALYEHVAYDKDGQLLAGSLMDYALPRADHMPSFNLPPGTRCQNNLLGVKGAGEAGAIGARRGDFALCDALGIVHIDMPATVQNIWQIRKVKQMPHEPENLP